MVGLTTFFIDFSGILNKGKELEFVEFRLNDWGSKNHDLKQSPMNYVVTEK